MKKILKYFKPFLFPVFLVVVLLFIQVMTDLNLPNYMSKIVDVGISQSGIESPLPEIISESGYNLSLKLMNDDDKKAFADVYKKYSKDDYYIKTEFEITPNTDVYVLNNDIKKKDDKFIKAESAYSKSIYSFTMVMKQMASENSSAADTSKNTSADMSSMKISKEDLQKLYQMSAMISLDNPEIKSIYDEAAGSAGLMKDQVGVFMTKIFYQELGIDMDAMRTAYIFDIGILMILITLIGVAAAILVGFLAARISSKVAMNIRFDIFNKVESFSSSDFDKFSTASLITRTTNDITQVQMFALMAMRMMASAPIMGVGGIIMAVSKSVSMSWLIALAVIVIICFIGLIYVIVMPKFKIAQKLIDKLNLVARENLSGMMVIRAFGTQKFEENRFDKSNKNLTKNQLFVNRSMNFMMPMMMFIMNLLTVLIVWVGAKQIENSSIQIGDMMAFMQYAMQIVMSFIMISMMFIMVPRASVSANRIAEVLAIEPSIKNKDNPVKSDNISGTVEFHNVSFRYQDASENVLSNISFTAKKGETTAFIGSTGSGKSTLINLIPRFYDVSEGSITIDGVDIRDMDLKQLRRNIGYIPQEGVLFTGDVNSNVAYGVNEISEDEIHKACEIAQASEFIEAMPDEYETDIAQGGTNVSGGQKQRLSIARAIAKKAPIYIFDDSFSALDFKTDAALRRALNTYTKDSCMLIVAQRISTIMNAEQIVVLDKSKVVGIGTHSYLLENCDEYREIAQSQLSKEELQ